MATPCNPNATDNAKKVLNYLYTIAASSTVLSGQWTVVREFDRFDTDLGPLFTTSGKYPAIIGIDYYHWSEPSLPGYTTFMFNKTVSNARALQQWNAGGLVVMNSHRYNFITGYSGNTRSDALAFVSNAQAQQALINGTTENTKFKEMLNREVQGLLELQNSGVVVIVRPWHEWSFYWGPNNGWTRDTMRKIWRFTIQYYWSQGVNNTLAMYGPGLNTGVMDSDWYPGSDVVDCFGPSDYSAFNPSSSYSWDQITAGLYGAMAATGKPIFFGEYGPGTANTPLTGTVELNLVSAINNNMPAVAGIINWWANHGIQATSNNGAAYMASASVITRDEVSLPSLGTSVPSAPQSVSASVTASGEVTVTWAAPSSDGGSAILGYDVAPSASTGLAKARFGLKPSFDGALAEAYMFDFESWLYKGSRQVYSIMQNAGDDAGALSTSFGPYHSDGLGRHFDAAGQRPKAVISMVCFDPSGLPSDVSTTTAGQQLVRDRLNTTLSGGGTNLAVVAGYDYIWDAIAFYMALYPNCILNQNWEGNGWWMKWGWNGNENLTVDAMAYVVRRIRAWQLANLGAAQAGWAIVNGGHLYTTMPKATVSAMLDRAAATGLLTHVGCTLYDAIGGNIEPKSGPSNTGTWANPADVFARYHEPEIDWVASEARRLNAAGYNIKLCFSEWGLQDFDANAQGGSADRRSVGEDDPAFILWMQRKLDSLDTLLDTHCYFEQNDNGHHTVSGGSLATATVFPTAQLQFRRSFGLLPSTDTSLVVAGLASQPYSFTVKAYNAVGASAGATSAAVNPNPGGGGGGGVGVAGVTTFSGDFTGTTGAGWGANWTTAIYNPGNGAVVDIQSNAGRMLTNSGGAYDRAVNAIASGMTAATNVDVVIELTIGARTGPTGGYPIIWFGDSTWNPKDTPVNGYGLQFQCVTQQWTLCYAKTGVTDFTVLGSMVNFPAGTAFLARLRVSGTDIKGRVWANDGVTPEPSVWGSEVTDSAVAGTRKLQLALNNYDTSSATCTWDNYTVTDLDGSPAVRAGNRRFRSGRFGSYSGGW